MLTKAARIKKCIWNIIVCVLSVSPPVRSFLITSCGLKPLASVLNFSLSFSIPHMLLKSVLDEFHLNQANWFETGAATHPPAAMCKWDVIIASLMLFMHNCIENKSIGLVVNNKMIEVWSACAFIYCSHALT